MIRSIALTGSVVVVLYCAALATGQPAVPDTQQPPIQRKPEGPANNAAQPEDPASGERQEETPPATDFPLDPGAVGETAAANGAAEQSNTPAVTADLPSELRHQWWQEYVDLQSQQYEHRIRVFEWQHLSTQLIFWMVLILVACGMVFSAIQFGQALMATRRQTQPEANPADAKKSAAGTDDAQEATDRASLDMPRTEIEASLNGIRVSSSILGVIILAISLLFFYLYLVHVYPINSI